MRIRLFLGALGLCVATTHCGGTNDRPAAPDVAPPAAAPPSDKVQAQPETIRDAGADTPPDADAEVPSDAGADAGEFVAVTGDLAAPAGACKPPRGGVPQVRKGKETGGSTDVPLILMRRGARASVDECARAAQARTPGLQGRLWMRFTLPASGGVTKVEVERGAGDSALKSCVAAALAGAQVPAMGGGTVNVTHYAIIVCADGHAEWPDSP